MTGLGQAYAPLPHHPVRAAHGIPAPASLAALRTKRHSAAVSVAKELTATTTVTRKLQRVLDVVLQIAQAFWSSSRFSSVYAGSAACRPQPWAPPPCIFRARTVAHQNDALRDQAGGSAFDVKELLHADVGPEARFGHNVVRQLGAISSATIEDSVWMLAKARRGRRPGSLRATASASA